MARGQRHRITASPEGGILLAQGVNPDSYTHLVGLNSAEIVSLSGCASHPARVKVDQPGAPASDTEPPPPSQPRSGLGGRSSLIPPLSSAEPWWARPGPSGGSTFRTPWPGNIPAPRPARSPIGEAAAASSPRAEPAESLSWRRETGWNRQAGDLPHPPALLRHSLITKRVWHPDRAGAPGAREREDDDDLHPRAQPGGRGVTSPVDVLWRI